MANTRAHDELAMVIGDFLDETGQWQEFKEFIEARGYTATELGLKDEE